MDVAVAVGVAVGIVVAEGKGGYVAAAAATVVTVGVSVDVCKTIGTTVCTAAGSRVEVTVALGVSATAAPCTVEAGGVGVDVDSRTGTAVGAAVGVLPVGDGATTAGGSGVGVDEGREVTLTDEITASTAVGTTTMSAASAVGLADIGVAVAACNSLISIGATVEVGAGVTALTVGTAVRDTETPASDVACSLPTATGASSHAVKKGSNNTSATSQTQLASLRLQPLVRPT